MSVSKIGKPIRVLVAPHNFELGGSQINALELIGQLANDPKFELVIFAPDGILAARARSLGVELHLDKLREGAPSWPRMRRIWRLVGEREIDLVHTYEWMPTVDAAYAALWARGVPVLSTVLSMDYPYFLPRSIPLVLGTRALVDRARREGRVVDLIEPPVDTEQFHPRALPDPVVRDARAECGAEPSDELIVVVGRLSHMLKLDGLLALIEATGELARDRPVRLAIVGDGPERDRVQAAVDDANARAGGRAIRVLGWRVDPLPYYLAADLAVGMGGSALRALAVGKPLVVQGEKGFWAVADADSVPVFREEGWYGTGDGTASAERCGVELTRLLDMDEAGRAELGRLGRQLVHDEFSLSAAGERLAELYVKTSSSGAPTARSRLIGASGLTIELIKSSLAMRMPALQSAVRAVRHRCAEPTLATRSRGAYPAVSVVIPCYNYAQYVGDAIASALEQEEVRVDVTVVDDGSTDGSREIAESWAARDSRVRLILHPRNLGHIVTFNDALAAATAPYVVKLDADDLLTPGSLARSARVLEAHPGVVFVYGDAVHVRGSMPRHIIDRAPHVRVVRGPAWIAKVARHRSRNPISQPEVMIRRAALVDAGAHRPEVPGSSDLHLWLRLASFGDVAWMRGAVQGVYRVHDASMRATVHSGLLADVRARRDAIELFVSESISRNPDLAVFARIAHRGLARDAVTNAFLDFESGRDPRPLMIEAHSLDARVGRSVQGRLLAWQYRSGSSQSTLARLGHSYRALVARWRWHRHRLFGV